MGPAALKELAGKLNHLLKIRSLPIGLKQYTSVEEMEAVHGLRRPTKGRAHTACQIVTQSRIAGFTITAMAGNPAHPLLIRAIRRHGVCHFSIQLLQTPEALIERDIAEMRKFARSRLATVRKEIIDPSKHVSS